MTDIVDRLAACCREVNITAKRLRLCGVYFFVLGDEIVYVGATRDIESRIAWHLTYTREEFLDSGEPNPDYKRFDRLLWFPVPRSKLWQFEGALIRSLRPIHNKRAPAYRGNDNEILAALGLPTHADELSALAEWKELMFVPRAKPRLVVRRRRNKDAA